MQLKQIRKIGLWVIVASTLVALVVLNVTGNTDSAHVNTVVLVAVIALIVWLLVSVVASLICHRR
jgi:amino acid transporter